LRKAEPHNAACALYKVKDINSWIQDSPEDVKIAVIAKFVKPQFSFPRDK
jgi:hypothetical protein